MSYDEEQHRKSRVVVETPTQRREVVQHQVVRTPERSGFSAGMIAAVALAAIAVTSLIFLFIMTRGDDDSDTSVSVNARVGSTPPVAQQPVIASQTPIPQMTPPITIVMPPTTTTTIPPVTEVPGTAPPAASTGNAADDAATKRKIERSFSDDSDLAVAGLTIDVIGGKAILSGTVSTQELRDRAERLARAVAGELNVVNRITVVSAPPE